MKSNNDTPVPEALRLAAWLNEGAWHTMTLGDVEAAGRELRRLHALTTAPTVDAALTQEPVGNSAKVLAIEALLGRYHEAVWTAAQSDHPEYDLAGIDIAKSIAQKLKDLASPQPTTSVAGGFRCAACKAPVRAGWTCDKCDSDEAEPATPQPAASVADASKEVL